MAGALQSDDLPGVGGLVVIVPAVEAQQGKRRLARHLQGLGRWLGHRLRLSRCRRLQPPARLPDDRCSLRGRPVAGIREIPAGRQVRGRVHHRDAAAERQQAAGQLGHRLAAHLIGIGPQQHLAASKRLPAALVERLAAAGPGAAGMAGEQPHRGIGGLLPLGHQHRTRPQR